MEQLKNQDALVGSNQDFLDSKRKLTPKPDASWRIEEVSLGGDWPFWEWGFVAANFPFDLSMHLDNLTEVRSVSYFDKDNRLMRQEFWRLHRYDKEYWNLAYEGVYSYGTEKAELTYWETKANKAVTSSNILDHNGFLVEDSVLRIMSHGMPFGHAIEAKYKPDPSWKRIEEPWTTDDGNHRALNVKFLDCSNELRRFERWLCDSEGRPIMLMREEHIEITGDKARHRWHNQGGYIVECDCDPLYLTPKGKEIPPKKSKTSLWVTIAIIAACAIGLVGFLASGDKTDQEEVVIRETVMPLAGEEGTFIPKTEIPVRYDSEVEISLASMEFTASGTVINWKVIVRSDAVKQLTIDPSDYNMLVIKTKGNEPEEVFVDQALVGSQAITEKTIIPVVDKEFSFTTSYPVLLGYMYINFPNSVLYSSTAIKVAK